MSKRENLWTRFKRRWADPTAFQPPDTSAGDGRAFRLVYQGKEIGRLSRQQGRWTFRYADDFHTNSLRTITEFPDTSKTYESSELWPFFSMRIPSVRRSEVKEIVDRETIDVNDEVTLLQRFGRRTVANPFELIPSP